MSEINLRSLGICSPATLNTEVPDTVLIGAGGIGSSVMMALVKMGLRDITVYDDDTLEIHNVGNQFLPLYAGLFGGEFLGDTKVRALEHLIEMFMPPSERSNLRYQAERFKNQPFGHLTIVTVDSMAVRSQIWEAVNTRDDRCMYYIDARMGAQTLRIYTVNMLDAANREFYEASLYSDDSAVQEPCTERGIVYTSMFAGGHVANIVKQLAAGPQRPPWTLSHLIEHNTIISSKETVSDGI